jgi:hypothetical protein
MVDAAFNHAYAVLDRGTADAIADSALLRDLGAFEVRTTRADDDSWTGRYLRGRSTYLEIFGDGDIEAPVGATGIGLSPDHIGGLDLIEDRLARAEGATPVREHRVRQFDDGEVPWFEALSLAAKPELSAIWVMEYDPAWFADPRSGSGPAAGEADVSRRRYLAGGYDVGRPLLDVVGVHLSVTPDDLDTHRRLFTAAGLVVSGTDDGLAAGDGTTAVTLVVAPERAAVGLRRLDLSLSTHMRRQVEDLGSSRLIVGPDATATWEFNGA